MARVPPVAKVRARSSRRLPAAALLLAPSACAVPVMPPPSSPPTADAALARMHQTFACGRAIQATAKIDHVGDSGRIRGDLLLLARRPASVRMDVVSPFGVALATLTTDGAKFALSDLHDRRFYVGPASGCNIARLTTVPVPVHVLVDLLRGEAPVLRHDERSTAMAWSERGYWTITIHGAHEAVEEIRLAPRPEDRALPWDRQRMRVLGVRVAQQGYELYRADLAEHAPAPTAGPREDPDGLTPPVPPSGPSCDAEIPRKIHIEVAAPASDVRFLYQKLDWNPPLLGDSFEQAQPPGTTVEPVTCESTR